MNMITETTSLGEDQQDNPAALRHRSEVREVFNLWIVNLLLSILTLGLYSFWGRTKMRQLLWSRTSLLGDDFEYHGRGIELFVGFLVASVLFFGSTQGLNFFALTVENAIVAGVLQILPILIVLILFPTAFWTQRRYILTRTSWRGVRGDQPTGWWGFVWRAIGGYFLTIVSLGLAFPFVATKAMTYLNKNSRFGDTYFTSDMRAGPIFKGYAVLLVSYLLMVAAFGWTIYSTIQDVRSGILSEEEIQARFETIAYVFFGVYAALLIIGPVIYSFFQLQWWRQFFGTLSLAGATISVNASLRSVIIYLVKVFLVMLITLGLGRAFVMRMKIQFLSTHLQFHNIQQVENLAAEAVTELRTGEGMADALFGDFGIGF